MIMKKTENQPLSDGYLKQPNDLVAMRHSFDVTQGRVVSAIIEKLQNFISLQCEEKDVAEVLSQFRDPEFPELSRDNLVLTVSYKDVGVCSKNYESLRQSLVKMAKIPVDVVRRDNAGKPWTTLTHFCTPMLPQEYDAEGKLIPSRYQRYFKVVVSAEVLRYLIDTKKGWSLYLRRVVMSTKNKYAFRFYLLMSQWKNDGGHEFSVLYIREWLKMGDRCARWNDFMARVIRPAEKELKSMYEKGISDLYFETFLIYPEGKHRGQPDGLNFKVYGKGSPHTLPLQEEDISPADALEAMLLKDFAQPAQNRKDLLSMVTEENRADFVRYCQEVFPKACENKKRKGEIKQFTSYCYASLVKFLRNWQPAAASPVPADSTTAALDRYAASKASQTYVCDDSASAWQKVLAVCRERWTGAAVEQWLDPLVYRGRKDEAVHIKLPTSLFGREMVKSGYYEKVLAVCRELYPTEKFILQ